MKYSEFVLTVLDALAREESVNTSKRVKSGKKMNIEKGRVLNIVYGYDKTIGDYCNLEINKLEAEVISQIYKWYMQKTMVQSKLRICSMEEDLKQNCNWSQNAVCQIYYQIA